MKRHRLDAAREKRLLAALAMGSTYRHAAQCAGVSEDTVSRRRERDAAFAERHARACANAESLAVGTVQRCMIGGALQSRTTTIASDGSRVVRETFTAPDLNAAIFFLERRFPADYGRSDRVEIELQAKLAMLSVELNVDKDALLAEARRLAGVGQS